MKDFSNANSPPDMISIMKIALDAAIVTLPDPSSSAHVMHRRHEHHDGRDEALTAPNRLVATINGGFP
jgi:hypothetical protein